MSATIDIKTPAGKSLEGFPLTRYFNSETVGDILRDVYAIHSPYVTSSKTKDLILHPGDTITITILP